MPDSRLLHYTMNVHISLLDFLLAPQKRCRITGFPELSARETTVLLYGSQLQGQPCPYRVHQVPPTPHGKKREPPHVLLTHHSSDKACTLGTPAFPTGTANRMFECTTMSVPPMSVPPVHECSMKIPPMSGQNPAAMRMQGWGVGVKA